MSKFSLTYQGVGLWVLGWVFTQAGVVFVPAEAEAAVAFVVQLVGVVVTLVGRYRAGGISAFGVRK